LLTTKVQQFFGNSITLHYFFTDYLQSFVLFFSLSIVTFYFRLVKVRIKFGFSPDFS